MLHAIAIWLLVAAFSGAGLFNAIGAPAVRRDFTRWGFPGWWCHLTGGLKIGTAVLIAVPGGREAGLLLGAAIIAAAVLTVVRHHDVSHSCRSAPSSPC